jgi:hypothetical protein
LIGGNANPYVYLTNPIDGQDLTGDCWGCHWFKKHWKAIAITVVVVAVQFVPVVDVAADAAEGAELTEEGAEAREAADGGASCGGESFTSTTEVVMADGSDKPLDEVRVGDQVETTDPATGKTTARAVSTVWVKHDIDLMDVTVVSGGVATTIHATQHHLFWDVTRKAWVEADNLAAKDQLRTDNGKTVTVSGTTIIPGATDMWDLTVSNNHDFYIDTTTTTVLVHNCPSRFGSGGDRGLRANSVRNTD